ncbi:lytic transglycosylase domain-containing protein [Indiicoccus explosivorum]|uniref:lytic transglycosylase domain-containing protein n=1 Tax=Indiicoccus explosivorum TaxID=1917864 RepID=UPI000B444A15|nr:lytic transglycosylase domain-containing protein [Indiicoccus explosivorum]
MGKKKKKRRVNRSRIWTALLLAPVTFVVLTLLMILLADKLEIPQKIGERTQEFFGLSVPDDYIPLYKEAADAYGIPWTLLAAHHRVETKFSTMDPLVSPVGAEGHLQFMPCTFVGWSHPTCSGLGEGDISDQEKTDPAVIEKYGGYGVDGNGDGKADPFNLRDALYSAANYLAANGAAEGELEQAVFRYNHSKEYVEQVMKFYRKYEEQLNS